MIVRWSFDGRPACARGRSKGSSRVHSRPVKLLDGDRRRRGRSYQRDAAAEVLPVRGPAGRRRRRLTAPPRIGAGGGRPRGDGGRTKPARKLVVAAVPKIMKSLSDCVLLRSLGWRQAVTGVVAPTDRQDSGKRTLARPPFGFVPCIGWGQRGGNISTAHHPSSMP